MELQSTDWKKFTIEDLPDCVLFNVFNLLSYDQVANLRPVSVRFEAIARQHLNHGFYIANLLIDQKSQEIESQMPKRKSLRHRHPLNRQSMFISLLSSTKSAMNSALRAAGYEDEHFCFFFGKLIDELLKFVGQKNFGEFAWEGLEELNDLTPMAMTHLREILMPISEKKNRKKVMEKSSQNTKRPILEKKASQTIPKPILENQASQTITQVLSQKTTFSFYISENFIKSCIKGSFDLMWRLNCIIKCIALTSYSCALTTYTSATYTNANWAIAKANEEQVQSPNIVRLTSLVEQQNQTIEEQKKMIEALSKQIDAVLKEKNSEQQNISDRLRELEEAFKSLKKD